MSSLTSGPKSASCGNWASTGWSCGPVAGVVPNQLMSGGQRDYARSARDGARRLYSLGAGGVSNASVGGEEDLRKLGPILTATDRAMAYARPLLLLAACLAALLYFTPSAAVRSSFVQPTVTTAHRTRLPPPTRETFTTRTVAVGDVHGDLPHLAKILRFAGLVNLKGAWIGGSSTLVQTGDIVDRGKDTIALYQWFDRLRAEAGRDGGAVVSLLGNHELMNGLFDSHLACGAHVVLSDGRLALRDRGGHSVIRGGRR